MVDNFKLEPVVFHCKESKENDKKKSLILRKKDTKVANQIRPRMQCVITTSKNKADLWEARFDDKKGKLRIIQIKDIKKNKVKYNIKKD